MLLFRSRPIRRGVVVVLGAVLLAAAGALPAHAVSYAYSGLWSGVVSNGGGYTAVTADVTVPRVSTLCGASSNVVAFIGLGGWNRLPFVQSGFTVTPKAIGAWWEVFDKAGRGPTVGVPLTIRPGDRMRLSLSFSANRSVLTFRWENLTRHVARSQRITNAARYYNGATADYIVERSWYPYRGAPLARYSPITFSGAKAIRYGRWVAAYNSGSTRVTMLGATSNTVSRVTAASGTTFTTAWSGCR
jgi:hypothetical protein